MTDTDHEVTFTVSIKGFGEQLMSTNDYSATVVADSLSADGFRLITVEATYPRFVHSELMTHRHFSRNAASSRAIPVGKSIERVRDTPAYPVHWGAEKPGMQPGAELTDAELANVKARWDLARQTMASDAAWLAEWGLHKSLVNRIIEPWSWVTTIITSTDWENFLAQRANSRTDLAQPELARIADLIEGAIDSHRPTLLEEGDWHLPYIDEQDMRAVREHSGATDPVLEPDETAVLRKVSVARCARVSLLNHDGSRELAKDVGLYDKLVGATPMHASPLEHVATPDHTNAQWVDVMDFTHDPPVKVGERHVPRLGNLLGWAQLRHMVEETR